VSESIFTRIIRGDIPSHKVYEDEKVFAFLDIAPLAPGHVLVVPKEPAATLDTLSDESAAAVGRLLPRIARAVMAATGTRDYNVLQNNGTAAHQAVPHVHFHVIPKPPDGRGLGVGWPSGHLGAEEGKRMASAVAAELAKG
jgi:histidine triad (HIT) family protein